jgi:hypothetical protein
MTMNDESQIIQQQVDGVEEVEVSQTFIDNIMNKCNKYKSATLKDIKKKEEVKEQIVSEMGISYNSLIDYMKKHKEDIIEYKESGCDELSNNVESLTILPIPPNP